MTSRERFLATLDRKPTDRLCVTTHHLMPYFLDTYMDGMGPQEFFEYFGADGIKWVTEHKAPKDGSCYENPDQNRKLGFLEAKLVFSPQWRISEDILSEEGDYKKVRYTIHTPSGELTTVLESNIYTTWVAEHLIKDKRDIDIIGSHVTHPACDTENVIAAASEYGDKGIIRGHIPTFDLFGQPGCWQDACCLAGVETMIMATFDDPQWVHTFLDILCRRKVEYAKTLTGAPFDLHELGGGDASTTIISPMIFNEFVAPYDKRVIETVHEAGQRVVYHTCGGMMPILEDIAAMGPDAMETFTPAGMGGDTDLAEAKRRIGDRVCMIGGFDQGEYFERSTQEETRAAVRACFEAAGKDGGFVLCPSDHFFDAKRELLKAFFDEAKACTY